MKHFLILLLLIQQSVYGQISTKQISLLDNMKDSAIVFNKYDNLVVIKGWEPGMEVSFSHCSAQHINGDTFNVKANFTGSDQLRVKRGEHILYERTYQVRSFATAAANTTALSNTATAEEVLNSLTPVHKAAVRGHVRIAFIPKVGDISFVEINGTGKYNPEIRQLCSKMQSGDKILVEFPGTALGAKKVTLR